MKEVPFSHSLVKFIQEETERRGWYNNGQIDKADALTVIQALGEVTSTVAREVIHKDGVS